MNKAIAIITPETNNNITGRFLFESKNNMIHVTIQLSGLQPNKVYACHIHEYGDMSNGCQSLGSHFNPTIKQHGSDKYNGQNHHAGDLMNNLQSDHRGFVYAYYHTNLISLEYNSPFCILGRSIVIHKNPDDEGQQGLYNELGQFIIYQNMSLKQLQDISQSRGYNKTGTKQQLIDKLNTESLKTGNAGGRIACAIIGICKN